MFATLRDAKKYYQCNHKTIWKWADGGDLKFVTTPGGQRRYELVDRMRPAKIDYCYCRVSSAKQCDDLERQVESMRSEFPTHRIVTDVASGINWKRKGLKAILESAMHGTCGQVVVAHRDRIARFGFELVEWVLRTNGADLVVQHKDVDASPTTELAEDIIAITTVFACKHYGKRRYAKKSDDIAQGRDISECSRRDDPQTVVRTIPTNV
jgi:predicted site-specific integrase-resolvase